MSVHFSSENQKWETPLDFFEKINSLFNFDLDCCAEDSTAKVSKYYTKEDDALSMDWFGTVWCNPPYGREQVKFIKKASLEFFKHKSTIVLLIPARPDTKVWHDVIFKEASSVCFVRGRLKFGGSKDNAPFPCAIVVFGDSPDLSEFGFHLRIK